MKDTEYVYIQEDYQVQKKARGRRPHIDHRARRSGRGEEREKEGQNQEIRITRDYHPMAGVGPG